MTFLLNFVHFEAIFAYSETIFADSETDFANFETKIPDRLGRGSSLYSPMQDVAPSAVRIADAIDAINCTINLVVSFLLITIQILVFTV
jgi:hypothetical protein